MGFFKKVWGRNRTLAKKRDQSLALDPTKMPTHLAIIMDGNGRWAKRRGLPRSMGHYEGAKALKRLAVHCHEVGVKNLTVYAFSTENWQRPKDEVSYLMKLLVEYLDNIEEHLENRPIRVQIIGDKDGLSDDLNTAIDRVENLTGQFTMTLSVAVNYGSRSEITRATRLIAQDVAEGKIAPEAINEQMIASKLYTHNLPDPEMLVRTSGEMRISNYLLWQCAYSEFFFVDTLWPDFGPAMLDPLLLEFQSRSRRFGGLDHGDSNIK